MSELPRALRAGPPGSAGAAGPVERLLDSRLVLVTGKGGTGKTTFAAALAVLGAVRGRRVAIVELD
ncbi:MAG: hypothetical protein H0V89_02980, partial [Deltaproteobacteria bacterium]|nr:hypothetical protein [Deltaproteobacteria bacterium]